MTGEISQRFNLPHWHVPWHVQVKWCSLISCLVTKLEGQEKSPKHVFHPRENDKRCGGILSSFVVFLCQLQEVRGSSQWGHLSQRMLTKISWYPYETLEKFSWSPICDWAKLLSVPGIAINSGIISSYHLSSFWTSYNKTGLWASHMWSGETFFQLCHLPQKWSDILWPPVIFLSQLQKVGRNLQSISIFPVETTKGVVISSHLLLFFLLSYIKCF